jgi:quercetin dioxygenase-like cupin family protein
MLFTQIGEGAIVGTQPVEYQQEARLIKGDSITIASGVMHAARFLEDTWYTAFLPIVDPDWPSWGK